MKTLKNNFNIGKYSITFSMILIVSCDYQQAKKEAPEVNEIRLNQKFKINLPENHRDGYTWSQTNKNLYCVEDLNQVWHGNEKGIDFNYKTKALGTDTLHFVKRKYTDTLEIKKFIVHVN